MKNDNQKFYEAVHDFYMKNYHDTAGKTQITLDNARALNAYLVEQIPTIFREKMEFNQSTLPKSAVKKFAKEEMDLRTCFLLLSGVESAYKREEDIDYIVNNGTIRRLGEQNRVEERAFLEPMNTFLHVRHGLNVPQQEMKLRGAGAAKFFTPPEKQTGSSKQQNPTGEGRESQKRDRVVSADAQNSVDYTGKRAKLDKVGDAKSDNEPDNRGPSSP